MTAEHTDDVVAEVAHLGRGAHRLSATTIVGSTLRIWRRRFLALTLIAAMLEAPLVIAELLFHEVASIDFVFGDSVNFSVLSLPVLAYATLSHHFLSGLLERVVGAEQHGHDEPTLRAVFRRMPWMRLLVADILLFIVLAVSAVFFIIPAVVIATFMAPLFVIINLEDLSIRDAVRRSVDIVRGHFWGALLTWTAVTVLEGLIVSFVSHAIEERFHSFIGDVFGHAIPATLVMPGAALPIVIMTFELVELRKRKAAATGGEAADVG